MSYMPTGITGEKLDNVAQFMAARELPASVRAFMGVKDTLDNSAIIVGADAEARKSGFSSNSHSKLVEDGDRSRGEDSETREEKDRRKLSNLMQQAQQYAALAENIAYHEQNVARLTVQLEEAQQQLAVEQARMETTKDALASNEAFRPAVSKQEADNLRDERGNIEAKIKDEFDDLGKPVMVNVGGTDVEYREMTIGGKTYLINEVGYMKDENGNVVSDEDRAVLAKGDDPAAQELSQFLLARKEFDDFKKFGGDHKLFSHAERESLVNLNEFQKEKVEAAQSTVTEVQEKLDEEKTALDEAKQKMEQFKADNPDFKPDVMVDGQKVSLNESGDFVDESGNKVDSAVVLASLDEKGAKQFEQYRDYSQQVQVAQASINSGAQQPYAVASLTEEEYSANQSARRAVTDNSNHVGAEKIDAGKLKLNSHFRDAVDNNLPETKQPENQPRPEVARESEIAFNQPGLRPMAAVV